VVIVGLLVEMTRLWRGRAADARRRERRRLAAELHDGLAQELAFLRTTSSLLANDPANQIHLANVQQATERALSEARLTIAEYGGDDVALAQSIADVASEVESRFGCHVLLDLDDVSVGARTAHELERAAREALLNAARHAAVDEIRVRLHLCDDQVRLSVADDGLGFTRSGVVETRFGLTAMRERAERLGGRCSIRSVPRHGTSVAIEVPRR
jgi:signal transduction histidine kinase